MNTSTSNIASSASNTTAHSAADIGTRVSDSITQHSQAVHARVDDMLTQAPTAINNAIRDAGALARSGIERARDASTQAREQIELASDRTVSYIKDEPVKSILIAVAVGAVSAALIGWVATGSRSAR